jgi:multiple sugar transport system substrate-binding protein
MVQRRGVLLLAAAAMASPVVTACGGVGGASSGAAGSSDAGTLTTLGFGGDDEVGAARTQAFKDAFSKVDLKVTKGGFDPQQFLSAVASGNSPDLVYMDRQFLGTYARKGALQPLDSLLSDAGVDKGQYRPAALKEVTLDGKVYGIPEFYITRSVLVNVPLLQRAGMSVTDVGTADWNRLSATVQRLAKVAGGKVLVIAFDPKLPEFLPLWARANGADMIAPDGRPNFDDPKVVEALEYTVGLINEQGGWSNFKAFRDTWDLFGKGNPFAKSQVGALPMEGWYLNTLVQAGSVDLLSGQPFTDRQGKPISWETGLAWAVPKGAKNAKLAAQFMKTMTAVDTWLKAAAARQQKSTAGGLPFTGLFTGNKAADDRIRSQYVKTTGKPGLDAAIDAYYQATDIGAGLAASPVGSELQDAWQAAVNRVLSGQARPVAALRQAQQDATNAYRAAEK